MSDIELLRMALERLEWWERGYGDPSEDPPDEVVAALRKRLCGAEPAPHRFAAAVPSERTTIRMGGAVMVCSINDAACAEVPASRRCAGCPVATGEGR